MIGIYRFFQYHCVFAILVCRYLMLMYVTDLSPLGDGCVRGQATPECNAAFFWDQKLLGTAHMYAQPTYQRLPQCSACSPQYCPGPQGPTPGSPAWYVSIIVLFLFIIYILLLFFFFFKLRISCLCTFGLILL
jgi:hypothetical protein